MSHPVFPIGGSLESKNPQGLSTMGGDEFPPVLEFFLKQTLGIDFDLPCDTLTLILHI